MLPTMAPTICPLSKTIILSLKTISTRLVQCPYSYGASPQTSTCAHHETKGDNSATIGAS